MASEPRAMSTLITNPSQEALFQELNLKVNQGWGIVILRDIHIGLYNKCELIFKISRIVVAEKIIKLSFLHHNETLTSGV